MPPLPVPFAEEPDDEDCEEDEPAEEDEKALAALGFEGAAPGGRLGVCAELVVTGVGERGGVEPVMGAGAAVDEELVATGSDPLGFDARGFFDDAVELVHALPKALLLLQEFALTVIQGGIGLGGASAGGHVLLLGATWRTACRG